MSRVSSPRELVRVRARVGVEASSSEANSAGSLTFRGPIQAG